MKIADVLLIAAATTIAAPTAAQLSGRATVPGNVVVQRPQLPPVSIPAPQIAFLKQESWSKDGRNWVSYYYELVNRDAFPAVFWTPAPSLPPCGANTNASRAWLDIYDASGARLNRYCAEKSTAQFAHFAFTLEQGKAPPPTVYVTITDRFTGRVLTSNTAATGTAPPPPIIH